MQTFMHMQMALPQPLESVKLTSSAETVSDNHFCCSRILIAAIASNDCITRNGFGEIRFVLGAILSVKMKTVIAILALVFTPLPQLDTALDKAAIFLQPIVGNGKHWELGGQVTAHHIWWRSEDENKSFGVYLEANVTHLFGAQQTRCFDLCSAGSSSRYMLAQKLNTSRSNSTW